MPASLIVRPSDCMWVSRVLDKVGAMYRAEVDDAELVHYDDVMVGETMIGVMLDADYTVMWGDDAELQVAAKLGGNKFKLTANGAVVVESWPWAYYSDRSRFLMRRDRQYANPETVAKLRVLLEGLVR